MQHFAVAVVFPGAGPADIVDAAAKNAVHIIDKENYNPQLDYKSHKTHFLPREIESINLLFVFKDGFSIYADTEDKLDMAMEKMSACNS